MPIIKKYRRRRPKKLFKRKAGFKKKFRRHTSAMPSRLITKVIGGFPDRYFAKLRVTNSFNLPTSISAYVAFKGNSPSTVCGPNVNNGGWNSNVPSGLTYFLGNSTDNPSVAPYTYGRVWSSSIKFIFVPTSGTGPTAYRAFVFPAVNDSANSIGASSLAIIAEQPMVRERFVNSNNTGRGLTIKHFASSRRMYGFKNKGAIEASTANYGFNYNSAPAYPWYWNFYVFGDNSTNIAGTVFWEMTYYCEFFQRNLLFSSAAPS